MLTDRLYLSRPRAARSARPSFALDARGGVESFALVRRGAVPAASRIELFYKLLRPEKTSASLAGQGSKARPPHPERIDFERNLSKGQAENISRKQKMKIRFSATIEFEC